MKHTFRIGGIHPPQNKTASPEIGVQPLPMVACVPLSQHIGAPARPIVGRGDKVSRGMLIAESGGFVSAPVHAPISGTVSAVEAVVMPDGRSAQAIVIKADEAEHMADTEARLAYLQKLDEEPDLTILSQFKPEELREIVASAGIVGLGGATFPSQVKLTTKDSKADILIINGCECEPYLMCDDALMRRWPAQAIAGVAALMKAAGVGKAVVAIEDNKPEAIEAMSRAAASVEGIEVMAVKTKYPQGGEKQLIEAVTGRRVGSGALPISVGAIVQNVATAFAVWQAVAFGEPLIERLLTVTGDIPAEERRNYLAAIGTPLSELPFTLPEHARAILGGPMMGRTAVRLDAPVTKGTSGLLLLKDTKAPEALPCVRCAACVDVCPMGLEPYLLSAYGRLRRWDDARLAQVADCIECASCSYICPSHRPLLEYIRIAKKRSRK